MKRKSTKKEIEENKFILEPVTTVDGKITKKRYEKIKEVGSGSYSRCYLVRNFNSDSIYVVKIIPKRKLQLLTKEKLIYQIKIHQSLAHPNVVHLDHWFEDEQFQYIFMEYCSKGNLEMVLDKKEFLSEKQIKYYGRQIVEGIYYIHTQNVLHRDLKLCNFYVDQHNHVKLGDFGFACQLANEHDKKRETCGTPNYIAPQAISGFGYSFSSDIWSIGVILYRLKYKVCPFEGTTVQKTLENVKLCDYKFPKHPKISEELKDLIQKILNINYDQRLSIQQIMNHPFFEGIDEEFQQKTKDKNKEKEKKGFSLKKLFSSTEKKQKQKEKKETEKRQADKSLKRSNSCETFKQIKQIFKSKSKPTLPTHQNAKTEFQTFNTLNQFTLNTIPSTREPKTNRTNFIEMGFQQSTKRESPTRVTRLNEFVKNQTSFVNKEPNIQKIKQKNQNLVINENKINSFSKQLAHSCKRFYLPIKVQREKDIIIVHYKSSLKQIIYQNSSYLIHRQIHNIYDMKGDEVAIQSISKLLKYIIENKVEIKQFEDDEEQFGEITIIKALLYVAHAWQEMKEGVILKYGNSKSFMVGKLYQQQPLFIYEEDKISLLYNNVDGVYKVFQGSIPQRIYVGWIKNHIKK